MTGENLIEFPEVAARRRAVRRRFLGAAVVVAAIAAYVMLVTGMREEMLELEARAAELEQEAAETAGPAERVKAMGERWRSFQQVTDVRRYPMMVLEHVTEAIPEGGVMLEEFEFNGREVQVQCEARDTQAAYEFFNAVTSSEPLKVLSWSMERPRIDWEGAADFTLKGKMR